MRSNESRTTKNKQTGLEPIGSDIEMKINSNHLFEKCHVFVGNAKTN